MQESLKLTILAPERRLLDREAVRSVTLTGSEGEIEILPGHAAMIGNLETGLFRYQGENGDQGSLGVISTGFFEVNSDEVTVMAETIELQGEIDASRAKQAQQKAETGLREADLDEHRFKKYQLKLQRSLVRQQIASKEHES